MTTTPTPWAPDIIAEELEKDVILLKGKVRTPSSSHTWRLKEIPDLKHFLALSLHCHFVTSPSFGTALSDVPGRCQFLLWENHDGTFGVMVPLLDGDYRTEAAGGEGGLALKSSCGEAGRIQAEVTLAMVCQRPDPYAAIADGIRHAVTWMRRGRLRTEKAAPRWADYLGWCTWDAFYADVDEQKILEGLARFREGGILPGQMIIDEGWQDYNAKNYLLSYGTKKGAFTGERLAPLVRRIKDEFGIKMVGCWRTLFGELRGVDVDSPGFSHLRKQLVLEPGTASDTFGVVAIPDVPRFHDDYGAALAAEGIDFVKIDFQSALHLMTYPEIGRAEGARIWQNAVQESVTRHFPGGMLNCMAMGSDEVYHTTTSNICRASDDYFPGKDDSHPGHIRQNLYNSLWLGQLQWPDWDMFQSGHPWAEYHAIARAVSGGPLYVSDKPGTSDCALLERLLAADGKTLRCDQPALPTRDILFRDPERDLCFLKAFNRCGPIGVLGLFHPNPDGELKECIRPELVEGLAGDSFAVHSFRSGFLGDLTRGESLTCKLAPREADLILFSPVRNGFAPLGLIDKINPAAAVLDSATESSSLRLNLRGGGRFAFYSAKTVREVRLDTEGVEFQRDGDLYMIETGARPRTSLAVLV